MHRKKMILAGGIAVAALVVALLALAITGRLPLKPRVALIGLDENELAAVRMLLGPDVSIEEYAGGLPLRGSQAKADLSVYRSAAIPEILDASWLVLPDAIANRTVPSLRQAQMAGERTTGMPILLDHFELAWNRNRLGMIGQRAPTDLEELESTLKRWTALKTGSKDPSEAATYALVLAGGDDETLLLFISALVASEGGLYGYRALAKAWQSSANLSDSLAVTVDIDSSGKASSFGEVLSRLKTWIKAGYLHPEWYNFKPSELNAFVRNKRAFFCAMLLSQHRSIDYDALTGYDSGMFPTKASGANRVLVAPLTMAAISSKSSRQAKALAALERLTDAKRGKEAAARSGRATSLAAAVAPDIQAADALAWAAGSPYVASGLFRDAFSLPQDAKAMAQAIRDWLRR